MTTKKTKILVVGGNGNMGSAMLRAWHLDPDGAYDLDFISPAPQADDKRDRYNALTQFATAYNSLAQVPPGHDYDAIIYALKPKDISDALIEDLGDHVRAHGLFITIAAGLSVALFQQNLPSNIDVVRAMPNTPLQINQGVTGLYAPPDIGTENRALATKLFASCSMGFWVEDEDKMHSITAISGSGPGFVFYQMAQMGGTRDAAIAAVLAATDHAQPHGDCVAMVNDYITAANAHGIADADTTAAIVRQTFRGAALLAESQPDQSFDQLRLAVTSPNGTTAAGIAAFQNGADIAGVLHAATTRSRALAINP